jgi:hypothetical protein
MVYVFFAPKNQLSMPVARSLARHERAWPLCSHRGIVTRMPTIPTNMVERLFYMHYVYIILLPAPTGSIMLNSLSFFCLVAYKEEGVPASGKASF